ncbi:MAG: Co2+/Mg2+ efflux protein ApaG [Planctomycetota bacterium]
MPPETDPKLQSPNSDTRTEGIRIQAAAQYVPADSNPESHQYIFAYHIVISNEGDTPARLRSRHWIIIDADNNRQEVGGDGVVGQTPTLAPGASFDYTSSCPLRTSWGTMEGSYLMERANGEQFRAQIGRFFLVPPAAKKPTRVR